jgi:hypothetical protein
LCVMTLMFSLCGCVSVKDTQAQLDPHFTKVAEDVELKTSNLKLLSSRFNQSFLQFKVSDVQTSAFTSFMNERLVDVQHSTVRVEQNFLDWLLFDSPSPFPYKYSVDSFLYETQFEGNFSFNFESSGLSTAVRCRISYLQTTTEAHTDLREHQDVNKRSDGQRENTFLSCRAKNSNSEWRFAVEAPVGKPIKAYFPKTDLAASIDNNWSLKTINESYQVLSNGSKRDSADLPPWIRNRIAGLALFQHDEQLAAVSIIGKPHLWLSTQAREQEREKAAICMFALFVFNDMDVGWNKP